MRKIQSVVGVVLSPLAGIAAGLAGALPARIREKKF